MQIERDALQRAAAQAAVKAKHDKVLQDMEETRKQRRYATPRTRRAGGH